jgi:hypothetical protein
MGYTKKIGGQVCPLRAKKNIWNIAFKDLLPKLLISNIKKLNIYLNIQREVH